MGWNWLGRMAATALFLGASASWGQSDSTSAHRMYNAMLENGRLVRAAMGFRGLVEEQSDDHLAKVGLGRALVALNRCEEALTFLEEARPTFAWTSRAAYSEALCHRRHGRVSEAEVALLEALWMNPELGIARQELIRLWISEGEWVQAERELEELESRNRTSYRGRVLRLELAMARGDDVWLDLQSLKSDLIWNPKLQGRQHALYLDGKMWLRAGDPVSAMDLLRRAVSMRSGQEDIVMWRAEALRRAGLPTAAREVAWRKTLRNSSLIHPVRARILVDLGDAQGAKEVLDESPAQSGLEQLASRWYLAEKAGRPSERWRQVWEQSALPGTPPLEQLNPLEVR